MAIMEYLDETHPQPPFLPRDPLGRARVRGPVADLRVRRASDVGAALCATYLLQTLKIDNDTMLAWVRHWQNEALRALETHFTRDNATGKYSHGDSITLADICLAGPGGRIGLLQCRCEELSDGGAHLRPLMQNDAFARAAPAQAARRAGVGVALVPAARARDGRSGNSVWRDGARPDLLDARDLGLEVSRTAAPASTTCAGLGDDHDSANSGGSRSG
jgi:glutathione S-transferase